MQESPRTVIVAVLANLGIALAKYAAGFFTGSAAMIAEAIHSTVDTGNEALLLLGMHRARKPADRHHPFGYGREVYFWSLVVAVVIFGLGGGAAITDGAWRYIHPEHMTRVIWNYAVLGAALIFESASWVVAYRALVHERPGVPLIAAVRASKDPSRFVVLLEDSAAIAGVLIALILGTFFAVRFPGARLDAVASMLIGLVLIGAAIFLMAETHSLLIGESADPKTIDGIRDLLEADERVAVVGRILTAQLAPGNVLLNLDLRFAPDVAGTDLPETIDHIEYAIQHRYPEIREIFIEAQAVSERSFHR